MRRKAGTDLCSGGIGVKGLERFIKLKERRVLAKDTASPHNRLHQHLEQTFAGIGFDEITEEWLNRQSPITVLSVALFEDWPPDQMVNDKLAMIAKENTPAGKLSERISESAARP